MGIPLLDGETLIHHGRLHSAAQTCAEKLLWIKNQLQVPTMQENKRTPPPMAKLILQQRQERKDASSSPW